MSKWNKATVLEAIRDRAKKKRDLSYSGMLEDDLPLLRAASRLYGTWEEAVVQSGLEYEGIRRYRSWSNEAIVTRIQELQQAGEDLSWRNVSLHLDPSLAAAATKPSHFGSWRVAIEAAGLDYNSIRRYNHWSDAEVVSQIRALHAEGISLNAKTMEEEHIALITAGRRRFGSWEAALTAAGLEPGTIALRRRRPKK